MTEIEERIQERQKKNGFMRHNFIEMESVARDRAVFRLTIRPESKNPYGMVHGGAIYTLADNATGTAAHTDGRYYVTQTRPSTSCATSRRVPSGPPPPSATGGGPRC